MRMMATGGPLSAVLQDGEVAVERGSKEYFDNISIHTTFLLAFQIPPHG
jgi:hypothetical protein